MKNEDIAELIPQDRLGEFASKFLQEFLKDGFGGATKRSTELHVFHLLETFGNLDSFDNTKLSHLFQITETRVKGFRYESKLRFPPKEEKYIERRILWSLATRPSFSIDQKHEFSAILG